MKSKNNGETILDLYIIRHGETDWNKLRKFQGQVDIELNERGRELARITGAALRDVKFDRIYSSPLKRAYETAMLIRGDREIPVITDDRLKEMSFGIREGESALKILADESDPFHYFFSRPDLYEAPEGGESMETLCSRAADFLKDKIEAEENRYGKVMIVAHGACNKAMMCHIRQHGIADFWKGNLQKNCSVSIIRLEHGRYTVLEDNIIFYEEQPKA